MIDIDKWGSRFAVLGKEPKYSDRERYKSDDPKREASTLGNAIWSKALEAVAARQSIEILWAVWQKLYDGDVFVSSSNYNLTPASDDTRERRGALNKVRTTCDNLAAWLQSMAFPENEKSWALRATPVAQMEIKAKQAGAGMVSHDTRLPENPDNAGLTPQMMQEGAMAMDAIQMAREAAEVKERIIDDYLQECDWKAEGRMAIDQAVQIGTGFLKGPVGWDSDHRRSARGTWARDLEAKQSYQIKNPLGEITTPRVMFVDAWDVYPDLDSRSIKESEFVFQRHDLSRNDLLRLMSVPGYMKEEIALAISDAWMGVDGVEENRNRELRFGRSERRQKEFYTMWEYTGSILFEEYCVLVEMLMEEMGKDGDQERLQELDSEAKAVAESGMVDLNVVIRVVNGRVISMTPTACNLSCGEIYHAFTPFPTSGVYGMGLPDTMEGLQKKMNALFEDVVRASRLGATAHLVLHNGVIPRSGSNMTDPINVHTIGDDVQAQPGMPAFEIHTIPDLTGNRLEMIQEIERNMDSVSGVPLIARGEGPQTTETASGLHLLNNNAQNYARRIVRMLDDQIIKPMIDSFNVWEEMYGMDEAAKGDQKAIARGASVLFSRPMLAEAIPHFFQTYAPDVDTQAALDKKNLMLEHAQAIGLDIDAVIKSDELIEKEEAAIAQAQAEQPPPPEIQLEQRKLDLEEQKLQLEARKIQLEEQKVTLQAQLEQQRIDSEERKVAVQLPTEDPVRISNS